MKQAKDPVCGMMVDVNNAAARASYDGKDYYFCATQCRDQFVANPAKYADPHAHIGGIPTPKFGSAGSGGAEYEPLKGSGRKQ